MIEESSSRKVEVAFNVIGDRTIYLDLPVGEIPNAGDGVQFAGNVQGLPEDSAYTVKGVSRTYDTKNSNLTFVYVALLPEGEATT